MPQVSFACQAVGHGPLTEFCVRLFEAAGLAPDDARLVADSLVAANLRGVDSHGVGRVPHYLNRIRHGSVHPRPKIRVEKLAPAAARVDGDHGLGQLVMHRAAGVAIELARDVGAGWVAVRNSSHCGALAFYGLRIADAGMIGLVFTHVDPMVIPFGSKRAFCGTNPICLTAPRAASGAEELATGAICLDMATSKAPWNAVANAQMENVPIPLGWAVDAEGNDTTDPHRVAAMRPVGGYKGSGLGMMIDVFCAMLGEAPFGPDIPKMYGGDMTEHRRLGGLVGAIDIARFVALERFHERIAEMIHRWGLLPPVEPGGRVLFPGEPELIERERRLREGIPIGLRLLDEFDKLAAAYGVEKISEKVSAAMMPSNFRCSAPN